MRVSHLQWSVSVESGEKDDKSGRGLIQLQARSTVSGRYWLESRQKTASSRLHTILPDLPIDDCLSRAKDSLISIGTIRNRPGAGEFATMSCSAENLLHSTSAHKKCKNDTTYS